MLLLRQQERLCLARRYNVKHGKWFGAMSPEILIPNAAAANGPTFGRSSRGRLLFYRIFLFDFFFTRQRFLYGSDPERHSFLCIRTFSF